MATSSMAGLRDASIIAMGLGLVLVAIALYRWATGGSDVSALGCGVGAAVIGSICYLKARRIERR